MSNVVFSESGSDSNSTVLVQSSVLKLFTVAWVIAELFHIAGSSLGPLRLVGLIVGLKLLFNPGSARLLVLFAFINVVDYLAHLPSASNHYLMAFFVNVGILIAAIYCVLDNRKNNRPILAIDASQMFSIFSVAGRYLLLIMYFFGIYHKINTDFLDPSVSCASALWDAGLGKFGLAGATWGHYLAIYTTFVVEGLAIFFLFTPKWKYWGFAIGMPFHLFIGFTGFAFYMDFCTLCIALYILFLPKLYVERFDQFYNGFLQKLKLSPTQFGTGLIVLYIVYYIVGIKIGIRNPILHMPVFALYAIPFYLSFLLWSRNATFASIPDFFATRRHHAITLLVALFFINGVLPYVGLKTESSINMYSNLFTEGGKSNHLIHGPVYLFDYQNKLAKIIESNNEELNRYVGKNQYWVELELIDYLERHPDTTVTFQIGDQTFTHSPEAPYQSHYSNLERRLLEFKPVDFNQPKVCTH